LFQQLMSVSLSLCSDVCFTMSHVCFLLQPTPVMFSRFTISSMFNKPMLTILNIYAIKLPKIFKILATNLLRVSAVDDVIHSFHLVWFTKTAVLHIVAWASSLHAIRLSDRHEEESCHGIPETEVDDQFNSHNDDTTGHSSRHVCAARQVPYYLKIRT
ncbi:hypothetical protein ACJX0J_022850, partial [Zea mays]